MLAVTEILRHCKTGLSYTHTRSGRFVHLTEHERGLGDNARLLHFVPQVVALTRTLSDAGEYRVTAVLGSDIAYELLNENRLADSGTAEKSYLTALCIRSDEVDYLDAGLEYLNDRALILKRRSLAVYLPLFLGINVALLVDRLSENIEHTSESLFTYGHLYTRTGRCDLHILGESLARCKHYAADDPVAHMLSDLHNAVLSVYLNGERVSYHRELSRGELHIYNRSDDLCYLAFFHRLLLSVEAEIRAQMSELSLSHLLSRLLTNALSIFPISLQSPKAIFA